MTEPTPKTGSHPIRRIADADGTVVSLGAKLDQIVAAGEVTTITVEAFGATDDPQVTDPNVADATVIGLLRGVLAQLIEANTHLAALEAAL